MDPKLLEIFVAPTLVLIGGVLGYLIKYYLDKKKELTSKNVEFKRENYKQFASLVIDVFGSSKLSDQSREQQTQDNVQRIYVFYKDYVLFASPEVINAFGDWMQYLYKGASDVRTNLKLLCKVLKAMRQELGLSNKGLGSSGEVIFKAILRDYSNFFASK